MPPKRVAGGRRPVPRRRARSIGLVTGSGNVVVGNAGDYGDALANSIIESVVGNLTPSLQALMNVSVQVSGSGSGSGSGSRAVVSSSGSGRGVSKPVRVKRLTANTIFIPRGRGSAGMVVNHSVGGSAINVGGLRLPPGVNLSTMSSTEDGTVARFESARDADAMMERYGEAPPPPPEQRQQETLRQKCMALRPRDRSAEDDSAKECVVCKTNIRCAALDPCGHTDTCIDCTIQVLDGDDKGQCPTCREEFTGVAFSRVG